MPRILLCILLGALALPALSQTVSDPAALTQTPPSTPVETGIISPVSEVPASEFIASDGNFGPHATCETSAKATGKTYNESLNQVLSQYPGYTVLDQHSVNCGDKRAVVLVLVTMNGALPAKIHAIDFTQ